MILRTESSNKSHNESNFRETLLNCKDSIQLNFTIETMLHSEAIVFCMKEAITILISRPRMLCMILMASLFVSKIPKIKAI
jgi:hypothetical protein